ncbi:MAG: tetraacyldisaccharide 4'-kinase [Rhizobiaceae bacterium]|nr:tetraacyldisaccharide 4'-kinase [Rhizobiaceae bacterium]MCV0406170.1 tetraacyldisaccharide 4'-kinase [Rhizobiaceae bacterium]
MVSEAPPFWWHKPDWRAWGLSPFSLAYGLVARHRMVHAPRLPLDVPVLCVGNLTVGGAGKTPVAMALAAEAASMGRRPGILSRGYGGAFSHPRLVDAEHDLARHVGDEPLLLARAAPVAVSPDRAAAAKLLREQGCDFLIMDDGFQSARIRMDHTLIVIDAARGIGNGHVIPGGPMRAPLIAQLAYADAVLRLGTGDAAELVVRHAARAGRAVYDAALVPRDGERLAGRRFLAFAGIGNPGKFFDSLSDCGGELAVTRAFPDHHFYSDDELADLEATARSADAELITTAKDGVRLRHGSDAAKSLLERLEVLEIELSFELDTTPRWIVEATIEAWRRRRFETDRRNEPAQ